MMGYPIFRLFVYSADLLRTFYAICPQITDKYTPPWYTIPSLAYTLAILSVFHGILLVKIGCKNGVSHQTQNKAVFSALCFRRIFIFPHVLDAHTRENMGKTGLFSLIYPPTMSTQCPRCPRCFGGAYMPSCNSYFSYGNYPRQSPVIN